MRDDPKTGQTVANPSLINEAGMSALSYALKTENQKIVDKLSNFELNSFTEEHLDSCINLLAQNRKLVIGNKNGLELFVRRLINDGKYPSLLEKATFFGNSKILKYLFYNNNIVWKITDVKDALKNAIMVDSADCVKIIRDFWQQKRKEGNILTEEIKSLAIGRGNTDILNILEVQFKTQMEFEIPDFKFDFNQVPKQEEYEYINIMEKIKSILCQTNTTNKKKMVKYEDLLKELHVKPVHYNQICEEQCPQKKTCARIRGVINLIDQIITKMSVKFKIFQGFEQIVVGSLKEQSKIGGIGIVS